MGKVRQTPAEGQDIRQQRIQNKALRNALRLRFQNKREMGLFRAEGPGTHGQTPS